jgi:hypothetical protein
MSALRLSSLIDDAALGDCGHRSSRITCPTVPKDSSGQADACDVPRPLPLPQESASQRYSDFQKEAQLIAEEFTQSDWEALEAVESEEAALR